MTRSRPDRTALGLVQLLHCRFSRGLCLWLSLALALPAVWPAPASAEGPPRLAAVAVFGGSGGAQEAQLLAAARQAMAEQGFTAVVEAAVAQAVGVRSGPTEEDYRKIYNRGVELLKKGRAQYEAAKLDQAIENLQAAKAAFRQAMAVMRDNAGLLSSHLYLGMAYLGKGLESRGREELRGMIILDPKRDSRELSSKHYPPKIRKLYRQIKDDVITAKRGKLEVASDPAGAEVYLDGLRSGTTPTVLPDLPVGEHFLTLRLAGMNPWSTSKLVVEGLNPVEAVLQKQASRAALRGQFRPVASSAELGVERITFLDDFALSSKSEIFLFLEILPDGRLAGQLYDMRNQQVSARREVVLGAPQAAARELLSGLKVYLSPAGYVSAEPAAPEEQAAAAPAVPAGATAPTAPAAVSEPPLPDKPLNTAVPAVEPADDRFVNPLIEKNRGSEERMWYESWWLWGTVIGVVVAGTGAYLLASGVLKKSATTSTLTIHTGSGQ